MTFIPREMAGTYAIEGQAWHCAENQCESGNHLWLNMEAAIQKLEGQYHDPSRNSGLQYSEHYSDSKKRSASCAVADSL